MKTISNASRFLVFALFLVAAVGALPNCRGTLENRNADTAANVVNNPETASSPVAKNGPSQSSTQGPNNILFIIDSSGSMKAKAGGKSKMDAAKEVVKGLVGELPANDRAGLMAYGHRQKKDCKDVELIVPIGPVDKTVFDQKVEALQPLGETPISFSIRQAADILKGLVGKKTVILISDGEESCKEDPCAIAADLKKADVDLQVHVVGFGIDTPLAKKQLTCIAEATGGTYKDAANADELKKSLEGMAKAAETGGDSGRLVTAVTDVEGKPIEYYVELHRPGNESTNINGELGISMPVPTSLWKVPVPPGTYDVKYWATGRPTIWKRNVEILKGKETIIDIGGFGRASFTVKDQNGNDLQMYKKVFADDKEFVSTPGYDRFIDLPSGKYDFNFWAAGIPEGWSRGVQIEAGQETQVAVTIRK